MFQMLQSTSTMIQTSWKGRIYHARSHRQRGNYPNESTSANCLKMSSIFKNLRVDSSVIRSWISQRYQESYFNTTARLTESVEANGSTQSKEKASPTRLCDKATSLTQTTERPKRTPTQKLHAPALQLERTSHSSTRMTLHRLGEERALRRRQERRGTGNPEGVGFVDQVGGQSAAVGVFCRQKR